MIENRSFIDRSFGPFTTGGIRQSTFTLISTAMGAGVLCIPFMFAESGWLLGIYFLFHSGLIACFSIFILIACACKTNKFTYSSLLGFCVGHWTSYFFDLLMLLYGCGAILTYLIFLGDFIPSLLQIFDERNITRTEAIIFSSLICVPLIFPKKLSALKYISPISTFSLVFTAIMAITKSIKMNHNLPDKTKSEISSLNFGFQLFRAFSITLFSYVCHLNVVSVASELVNPSLDRIRTISIRVSLVLFTFYTLIGLAGYFSFGPEVSQNFLNNYSLHDPFVIISRILMTCSLLFCIPININPSSQSLVHLLTEIRLLKSSEDSNRNGTEVPLLSSNEGEFSEPFKALRISISLSILIISAIIAIYVPQAASVVALLGGSFGTLLMMICPMIIFYVVFKNELSNGELPMGKFLTTFFVISSLASFSSVVYMFLNTDIHFF